MYVIYSPIRPIVSPVYDTEEIAAEEIKNLILSGDYGELYVAKLTTKFHLIVTTYVIAHKLS